MLNVRIMRSALLTLVLSVPAAHIFSWQASRPNGANPGPRQFAYVRVVDPCTVVTDINELKSVAAVGVSKAFPFTSKSGPYVLTASDPHVANINCSPLHMWIDAKVELKRTDILKFEDHGKMSFDTISLGHVISTVPASQPISSTTFRSATLCFNDIHVDTFNLKNVPSAIDNWIRGAINSKITAKEQCRDVTSLIAAYLASGATIPPQPQATTSSKVGRLVPISPTSKPPR